jgi:hypothetical protein
MLGGAPDHFTRDVKKILDYDYPDRWIGRNGPVLWPPWSPDLTPADFYLSNHLKGIVYLKRVNTRDDLWRLIQATAAMQDMSGIIQRTRNSWRHRTRLYIQTDVEHCNRSCILKQIVCYHKFIHGFAFHFCFMPFSFIRYNFPVVFSGREKFSDRYRFPFNSGSLFYRVYCSTKCILRPVVNVAMNSILCYFLFYSCETEASRKTSGV